MLKPTSKIKVIQELLGDTLLVRLDGELDEDTHFLPLEGKPKCLIIDLEKVSHVNSCGLRSWILWTQQLDNKIQIILRKCPKIVVDQINILDGFLPRGSIVESFYVPYLCDGCSHEDYYLAIRGRDFHEPVEKIALKNDIPLSLPCPSCHEKMELGVITAKYFRFFTTKKVA